MKNVFILITLYTAIYCAIECEGEQSRNISDISPNGCHALSIQADRYCCYYEGKNLDTDKDEKFCWSFNKKQIDENQVKNTIEAIEKGTDSHVTKPHSNVKLDCFARVIKLSYVLFTLLNLF